MREISKTYRGRSQRYPKRKNPGVLHRLNVYVTMDAYEKANRMAGPTTLSSFVEELIAREYRRREKRAEKELVLAPDYACTLNGAMSHSSPEPPSLQV